MAYRTIEITLIYAKDLKDVNLISKMAVYAIVTLSSDSLARLRTPPDCEGGRNPTWNCTFRFTVPADKDLARTYFFRILLRTKRVLGDRDVGEVRVPLSQPVQFLSYQVRRTTSGKSKGVLNFSYKLGESVGAPAAYSPPTGYPSQTITYIYGAYPTRVGYQQQQPYGHWLARYGYRTTQPQP